MPSSFSYFRKPDINHTMGIEIEAVFVQDDPKFPEYGKHYGFFIATKDGSIAPPDWTFAGREMVSQPLPVNWLCKEIDRLSKKIAPWGVNNSCGIHIHVSKKWLSYRKAEMIQEFYVSLSPAEQLDIFGRPSNRHCQLSGAHSRYRAVNTTNTDTIELRMFASGGPRWAKYCVRMAEYLVKNATTLNYSAALAARDYIQQTNK